MKSALVTGASGFLGRNLVSALEGAGWQVVTVGRQPALEGRAHLQLAASSWTVARWRSIILDARPLAIFHLAGAVRPKSVDESRQINCELGSIIIDALRGLADPPSVILAGSSAEYGYVAEADLPVPESHPCLPSSEYGQAKLAQTLIGLDAARRGVPVVVARIFNPIGAHMPAHMALQSFARRISSASENGPVRVGDLSISRDLFDVNECARILTELAERRQAHGKIVNVCSGRPILIREVFDAMVAYAGKRLTIKVDPDLVRHGEMRTFYGCTALLSRLQIAPAGLNLSQVIHQIFVGGNTADV